MPEITVTIKHEAGLHARPAGAFAQLAQSFEADVRVTNLTRGGPPVNAKSVIELFTAAVAQGHEIRISSEGVDEDDALTALGGLVVSNFDENEE